MLYELHPPFPSQVLELFAPLAKDQPMCSAVLAGVYPGQLFVDQSKSPQAAALFTTLADGSAWAFLTGQPSDRDFPQSINNAIFARQAVPASAPMIFFTCQPEDWHGLLATVFQPRQPVSMRRRHYVCRSINFDWQAGLPEGLVLLPLEEKLLKQPDLKIPEEVSQCVARWSAHPKMKDFGFVIVAENEIVAWVTVDFIASGSGDIGFFTRKPFRRRGLATLIAAAALEHGLNNGLEKVCWTCSDDNPPSYKIAEKLGLQREPDYTSYLLGFDEAQHLSMLAYSHLLAEQYQQMIDVYEKYFAICDSPDPLAYQDLATAWDALGNPQKAAEYRSKADSFQK